MLRSLCFASLTLALAASAFAKPPAADPADDGAGPWPAPVTGFVAPAPGEHPRLLFRKSDLPELRRRAATPEGQAIIKRLRETLDGANGDTFPKLLNASGHAYQGNKAVDEDKANEDNGQKNSTKNVGKSDGMPVGSYTIGHVAGYGLLYQLTGEKKYADLGRKAFETALEGVRDRDDRYSYRKPGGALRCGPSIGAYALGYDLCYDGWDPAFREKIATELMNYNEGTNENLVNCALGKRQHPGSNHWGAEIAGPTMVLLGIRGDKGADDAKIDELLKGNEACFIRFMTQGFGDHGFYPEGDGASLVSADCGFTTALRTWQIAGGRDFITPRPNASWITMKWVMMTLPTAGKGTSMFPARGAYDHNVFSRMGMSGSGTFCQGFAAITDAQKPALLWLYEKTFQPGDEKAGAPFDTINPYPHRAVQSFVFWPLGMKSANPAAVMPKAALDKRWSFAMFRNRWQDTDDIIVTMLLKDAKGNYSIKAGDVIVWGGGKKTMFPIKVSGAVTYFKESPTGGVISTSAGSFGVDFSAASGAEGLLVLAGPVKGAAKGATTLTAGKNTFTYMTIGKGAPDAKVEGDSIVIGGQTISYDGEKIVFAK